MTTEFNINNFWNQEQALAEVAYDQRQVADAALPVAFADARQTTAGCDFGTWRFVSGEQTCTELAERMQPIQGWWVWLKAEKRVGVSTVTRVRWTADDETIATRNEFEMALTRLANSISGYPAEVA